MERSRGMAPVTSSLSWSLQFKHCLYRIECISQAAAIPDTEELQYPLHIAALHGAAPAFLQRLYNCYPDAIKARTKTHGWTPLHLRLGLGLAATPGAVRILLELYPDACKVR